MRAGIVGAGIAGASCAGLLADAGWEVEIFEKARGAGGRLSSRRLGDAEWVALGSPFITGKRDPFKSQLREWVRQGWLEPIRGNVVKGRATVSWSQAQLQNHYQPLIEPSQIVRNLLGRATLHVNTRVAHVAPRSIVLEDGQVRDGFDCVIVAIPTVQAVALLDALPMLKSRLESRCQYRPIWSFAMRWPGGLAADVIQFDDELLDLAVRQPSGKDLWIVHSTHLFAETYLEASVEEASTRGASALMGLLALPWPVEVESAHLWRYAQPQAQLEGFWLGDRENRVALIGDGITGGSVERAWESGTRLAQALVQAEAELAL